MAFSTVFVISDDSAIRDSVSELISPAGLRAETFPSLEAWLQAVPPERPGCLVLDGRGSDLSAPDRLAKFSSICAQRPVLLLIDRGDVPAAVRALRGGALDVLEKPCRDANLLESVKRATGARQDADANAGG